MSLDRLIIGISGASGVQYGVRALELLQALPIETHLIMSKSAELTVHHELDCSVDEIKALADVYVSNAGDAAGALFYPDTRRNYHRRDLFFADAGG
jgi:flavin prenyltransferase